MFGLCRRFQSTHYRGYLSVDALIERRMSLIIEPESSSTLYCSTIPCGGLHTYLSPTRLRRESSVWPLHELNILLYNSMAHHELQWQMSFQCFNRYCLAQQRNSSSWAPYTGGQARCIRNSQVSTGGYEYGTMLPSNVPWKSWMSKWVIKPNDNCYSISSSLSQLRWSIIRVLSCCLQLSHIKQMVWSL
jgi:hypothetical protein